VKRLTKVNNSTLKFLKNRTSYELTQLLSERTLSKDSAMLATESPVKVAPADGVYISTARAMEQLLFIELAYPIPL